MAHLRIALLLALAAVVMPTRVMAQPADEPAETPAEPEAEEEAEPVDLEAAAAAYERARAAMQAGELEAAEAALQEAYDAGRDPAMLMGLAEVRQQRGDLPGTIEALEAYLSARPDAPDAEAVRARVATLRAEPGLLVVTAEPAGEISIDGELIGQTTPAELPLAGGTYQVTVIRGGAPAEARTVTVPFGGRVEVAFAPPAGVADEAAEAGAPLPEPDIESEEEDAEEDSGPSRGVWISASIAAGTLLAGTVVGFLALTEEANFDDMPSHGIADRGERLALFADVLFGVAAVAGISAVVLHFTSRRRDEDDEDEADSARFQLTPIATRRGAGLSGALRF